jgi:uncharacterized membrane protein (DUF4010 family)
MKGTQILIIQIVLFACLIFTFYHANKSKIVSQADKSAIAVLSILILGLQDKMKLLIWGIAVGVNLLVKLLISKKKEAHGKPT